MGEALWLSCSAYQPFRTPTRHVLSNRIPVLPPGAFTLGYGLELWSAMPYLPNQ